VTPSVATPGDTNYPSDATLLQLKQLTVTLLMQHYRPMRYLSQFHHRRLNC